MATLPPELMQQAIGSFLAGGGLSNMISVAESPIFTELLRNARSGGKVPYSCTSRSFKNSVLLRPLRNTPSPITETVTHWNVDYTISTGPQRR